MSALEAYEPILSALHEALIIPERWPSALDALAERISCKRALLRLGVGDEFQGVLYNPGTEVAIKAFMKGGWAKRNQQAERIMKLNEPRFVIDHDMFSDDEMEGDPYYADYLTSHDMRWGTSTFIRAPGNLVAILSLHRGSEAGPIDRETADELTSLRPHIARTTTLAAQMRLRESQAQLQILQQLGYPAAGLDHRGKLRISNPAFQAMIPSVIEDWTERVRIVSAAADKALANVFVGRNRFGATFGVPQINGVGPFIGHVFPVAGAARDIFAVCKWILAFAPIATSGVIDPATLNGLFDFTPAEARIASAIAAGRNVKQIAMESGRSAATVRGQLNSVLAKAGVSRQAELVNLLSSARLRKAIGG